ncbi:hypothetical protein Aperf_G00000082823 [Anoplocephala perfoliata]
MLTRNRGKSKSVVEKLGLAKKTKRRAVNSTNTIDTRRNPPTVAKFDQREKSRGSKIPKQSCELQLETNIDNQDHSVAEASYGSGETLPCALNSMPDHCDLASYYATSSSKKGPQCDWLPSVSNKAYKQNDKIIQQVLEEISALGMHFPTRRKYLEAKISRDELDKQRKDYKIDIRLKDSRQMKLYEDISAALDEINDAFDRKDAYLASHGLLRPNIRKHLRFRRERLAKRTKSAVLGRLRPNPRPRRFSDMVNPSNDSRGDRNVRVAAKKLAQAKSQATSHILQQASSNKAEARRGRPRKSSTTRGLTTSANRWATGPKSAVQTRPRRSGSMLQHIEWKFCYSATGNNEKAKAVLRADTVGSRKRRINPVSDYDENEEPVDDAEDAGEKNEAETNDVESERNSFKSQVKKSEDDNDDFELDDENFARGRSTTMDKKRRVAAQLSKSRSRSPIDSSFISYGGVVGGYSRRSNVDTDPPLDEQRSAFRRDFENKPVRRKGAFATPRLDGSSGEPGSERIRSGAHRRDVNRRLSLLDRVVLGLSCCVVRDEKTGDIHIKQLHNDDLNILLQRVSCSTFNVADLSTIANANNEPEYNITLSFNQPKTLTAAPVAAIAAPHRHTSTGPFQPNESNPSLEDVEEEELSPPPETSRNIGYSDDGEEADWTSEYKRKNPQHRAPTLNRFRTPGTRVRRRQPHPLQTMGLQRLSSSAAAVAAASAGRVTTLSDSSRRPQDAEDEGSGILGSSEAPAPQPLPPPFRRHGYRKVVRKVYTGTSTLPKILNRRHRPQIPTSGGPILQPPMASTQVYPPSYSIPHPPSVAIKLESSAAPVPVAENTPGHTAESVPMSPQMGADKSTEKEIRVVSTDSTTVVNVSGAPSTLSGTQDPQQQSANEQVNPASSMSASQLLRLKRNQDEQHQQQSRSTTTVASSPQISSVTVATPMTQMTSSIQAQQSAVQQPQVRSQRKLNPAQGLRLETGEGNSVDLDDGTDFELSAATLPPPPPPPPLPSAPSHPPHAVAVLTPPLPTISPLSTKFLSPPSTFLQPLRPTFNSPALVSVVRTLAPVASRNNGHLIPVANQILPVASATIEEGILTGRPVVATSTAVLSTATASSNPPRPGNNGGSKRQIVHKYHSFRKISPKSSAQIQNTTSDGIAVGATPVTAASNSQLLKCLLESGSSGVGNSTSPHSSSQSQTRTTSVIVTPRVFPDVVPAVPPIAPKSSQAPAHQSRGTWQVGGKAIVVGASVIKPASSLSRANTPLPTSLSMPQMVPPAVSGQSSDVDVLHQESRDST